MIAKLTPNSITPPRSHGCSTSTTFGH